MNFFLITWNSLKTLREILSKIKWNFLQKFMKSLENFIKISSKFREIFFFKSLQQKEFPDISGKKNELPNFPWLIKNSLTFQFSLTGGYNAIVSVCIGRVSWYVCTGVMFLPTQMQFFPLTHPIDLRVCGWVGGVRCRIVCMVCTRTWWGNQIVPKWFGPFLRVASQHL